MSFPSLLDENDDRNHLYGINFVLDLFSPLQLIISHDKLLRDNKILQKIKTNRVMFDIKISVV